MTESLLECGLPDSDVTKINNLFNIKLGDTRKRIFFARKCTISSNSFGRFLLFVFALSSIVF